MTSLAAVDSLDIQVIVDNVTDSLSSVPSFIETELGGLGRRRGGAWVLGGGCLCCAAHGLSCLLTVRSGAATHSVLFDTGPEDRVFEQNASRLGLDLGPVEAMVLSHGHWDHAGAMLRALQLILDRNGGKRVGCYVHPDMFRSRAITKRSSIRSSSGSQPLPSSVRRCWPGKPVSNGVRRGISPLTNTVSAMVCGSRVQTTRPPCASRSASEGTSSIGRKEPSGILMARLRNMSGWT